MSKTCIKCGGVLEDTADFCPLCGEKQAAAPNVDYSQPQQNFNQPNYNSAPVSQEDFHTGIGGWIGWILLSSLLGLIGLIITICCAKDKSVKNWAIATLIISAIVVVIMIIVFVVAGVSVSSAFSDYISLLL